MSRRFNWDTWDNFDEYRKDDDYQCASDDISGGTFPSSGTDTSGTSGTHVLTECQLSVPPRIDSFNIIRSSIIELRIIGETIY